MNADEPYSFRMEQTSYKSQDLVYEEPGHKLVAYLEMSGVWRFDWVGTDTEFGRWTEPHGEPISDQKRQQILARLTEWGRTEKVRIGIGPPVDLEASYARMRQKGWTVEQRADGAIVATAPTFSLWRLCVLVTLFGCLMGLGQILGSSNHIFPAGVAYVIGFLGWFNMLMRVNGPGKVTLRGLIAVVGFLLAWLVVPEIAGR